MAWHFQHRLALCVEADIGMDRGASTGILQVCCRHDNNWINSIAVYRHSSAPLSSSSYGQASAEDNSVPYYESQCWKNACAWTWAPSNYITSRNATETRWTSSRARRSRWARMASSSSHVERRARAANGHSVDVGLDLPDTLDRRRLHRR